MTDNKISIRQHCIPAYDWISRINKVSPIPPDLQDLEEKTAGGIIHKVRAILLSPYFETLPHNTIIVSGGDNAYSWVKSAQTLEAHRIIELR